MVEGSIPAGAVALEDGTEVLTEPEWRDLWRVSAAKALMGVRHERSWSFFKDVLTIYVILVVPSRLTPSVGIFSPERRMLGGGGGGYKQIHVKKLLLISNNQWPSP